MQTMARLLATALAVPLLALSGCGPPSAAAVRAGFAAEETCPVERVQVETSFPTDGVADDGTPLAGRPPPAVASDPGRLEMWRRQNASVWSERSDVRIYDIEGCGIKVRRVCWQGRRRAGCKTLHRHDLESEARTAATLREIDEEMAQERAKICGSGHVPGDFCRSP